MNWCLISLALCGAQPGANQAPQASRLTHTVNAYANWAPDGKTIVFQADTNGNWDIFTIRPDGTGLRPLITDPKADITPVYSPDGSKILFVSERDGDREVYVARADGSEQRNLSVTTTANDIHPVWSADGMQILFSSNRGNADTEDFDIYRMKGDGTGVTRVTSGPDVDTYASWSPDGAKIVTRRVVNGNSEVFVLNADGTGARNLTGSPQHYDGWPVWSSDGKRIAYAGGGPDHGNRYIFLVDPNGGGRVQVTTAWLPGLNFCYDTQPAFSHDGKRLAFTRYRPPTQWESAELFLIDVPPA